MIDQKRVTAVADKIPVRTLQSHESPKFCFKGKPVEVIDYEDKIKSGFHREISFVVEKLAIRSDLGPYGVRMYFLRKNGNWVGSRIITSKMFVGSDNKYKFVLPRVIFDEEPSNWTINLGDSGAPTRVVAEPAKTDLAVPLEG